MNDLYRVVGISKQSVVQFFKREELFEKKLQDLLLEVDILRSECGGCGVEKMYYTLKPDFIGRDRFISVMMDLGYRVKHKKNYIRTTLPAHYKYPNLIEGSIVSWINEVWQSDITYIHVGGRFYYLVFIIDVYSRRILSYSASDHMRVEANIRALKMATRLRCGDDLSNLIHHSDRGSQYIANKYTAILKRNSISISMGMVATDNAYAERINGTIKNSYLAYKSMKDLKDLRREVKKAVEHYNTKRPHNSLARRTPVAFEEEILNSVDQKRPTVIAIQFIVQRTGRKMSLNIILEIQNIKAIVPTQLQSSFKVFYHIISSFIFIGE